MVSCQAIHQSLVVPITNGQYCNAWMFSRVEAWTCRSCWTKVKLPVISDAMRLMWLHCNEVMKSNILKGNATYSQNDIHLNQVTWHLYCNSKKIWKFHFFAYPHVLCNSVICELCTISTVSPTIPMPFSVVMTTFVITDSTRDCHVDILWFCDNLAISTLCYCQNI